MIQALLRLLPMRENLTEQTMDVVYDNVMTYQLSYIRSLQLSSGL
ncbi:hypothetical protein NXW09_28970 [Bacteroides ovatus]|nr:hypothetical protein [Bacteroides ovatus]